MFQVSPFFISWYKFSPETNNLHQCSPLLPLLCVLHVLHDDKTDRSVVGARYRIRSILFAWVSALAVVHHAGDEEDEEQDDVAGNEDDEVQCYRINLHLVQHYHGLDSKPHTPSFPHNLVTNICLLTIQYVLS